jgi:hypothetical protein
MHIQAVAFLEARGSEAGDKLAHELPGLVA